MFGNVKSDFIVKLDRFRFRFLFKDGDPHFNFRRFDLHSQPPVKAGNQTIFKT